MQEMWENLLARFSPGPVHSEDRRSGYTFERRMMRIISGNFRGKKIKAPPGKAVRPTSDRVREAIFSILNERVRGKKVLDLFAGSGALGIEALSRGAHHAVFVEISRKVASILFENIRGTGVEESFFDVVIMDAIIYLKKAFREGIRFDVVFIDPPYESALGVRSLTLISELDLLSPGGLLIYEFPKGGDFSIPPSLMVEKMRNYGETSIVICTKGESET
jgi:16S rRNA (guanine966-N2)-methyltransferase